jgi:hypothetical protein
MKACGSAAVEGSSVHSLLLHQTEVSGHVHAPTALSTVELLSTPIWQNTGSTLELVWTICKREKVCHCRG